MTQQEYKEQSRAISEAISGLKQSQRLLDESFFNELLETDPYKGYGRVTVTLKKHNGEDVTEDLYITERSLNIDGTLNYHFNKVKKDGTPSSFKRRFWSFDNIISVTPA